MARLAYRKVRGLFEALPGALFTSVLTGVVTLMLLILVSLVVGGDNAEHRLASRCFANQTTELIREIVEANENLSKRIDLDKYQPISIDGVDCDTVLEHPEAQDR